jgi:hypothetical protein
MRATYAFKARELLFVSVESTAAPGVTWMVTETVLEAVVPDAKDRDEVKSEDPACPACEHSMVLVRIEPGEPDHQIRTYKCPSVIVRRR